MKLLHIIADWLFPPKCILCQKILPKEQTDLCHECRINVMPYPENTRSIPFVKGWFALWHYDSLVRKSIIRFKFQNRPGYAENYGRLLAASLDGRQTAYDIITWVPISHNRRRERGFDQTELLAKAVAANLGLEAVGLLRKIRHNPPQSGISGLPQRKANVLGAYEALSPQQIAGKRILLLDDVITTGATVSECARVLLTAGAKQVYCAAIAGASKPSKEQVKS